MADQNICVKLSTTMDPQTLSSLSNGCAVLIKTPDRLLSSFIGDENCRFIQRGGDTVTAEESTSNLSIDRMDLSHYLQTLDSWLCTDTQMLLGHDLSAITVP